MRCWVYGAFLGLVLASLSISRGEAAAPKAVAVPEDCIDYINIARTAKVDSPEALIAIVTHDEKLERKARAEVSGLAGEDTSNCNRGSTLTSYEVRGLLYIVPANKRLSCPDMVQDIVSKALNVMTQYPWDIAFDPNVWPYNDKSVQQMSYALYAGSVKVGCAMTADCQAGDNVLLCKFNPLLQKGSWPFGPDYFVALQKRQTDGINLSTLTAEDISKASGSIARPSVLFLGVAIVVGFLIEG